MLKTTSIEIENSLLHISPAKEKKRILDICEAVVLTSGTILCEANKPYPYVYFPLSTFISLVAPVNGHPSLEVAQIGNEGMLGATLVLDVNSACLLSIVQGSGTALRTTPIKLLRELQKCPTLLKKIKSYIFVMMMQQSQNIACICFHEVEERLARWLLMTHDRAHENQFYFTHKLLANMLGVQRSAISIAAAKLQRKSVIQYRRGRISVINRRELEGASCECYKAVTENYLQLLP